MAKKESNPRKITETLPNDAHQMNSGLLRFLHWIKREYLRIRTRLLLFFIVLLSLSSLVLIVVFIELLDAYEAGREHRDFLNQSLSYWQEVQSDNPQSPDVYYQIAYYSILLNREDEASASINEALRLDPEFTKAQQLREIIEKQ